MINFEIIQIIYRYHSYKVNAFDDVFEPIIISSLQYNDIACNYNRAVWKISKILSHEFFGFISTYIYDVANDTI